MDLRTPIGQLVKGTYTKAHLQEKAEVFGVVTHHDDYGKIVVQEDHSWIPLNKLGDIDLVGVNLYEVYKREARELLESYDLSQLEESDLPLLIEEIANTVQSSVGGLPNGGGKPDDDAQDAAADAIKDAVIQQHPEHVEDVVNSLIFESTRLREYTSKTILSLLQDPTRLMGFAKKISIPSDWGPILGAAQTQFTKDEIQAIRNATKALRQSLQRQAQGPGVNITTVTRALQSLGAYLKLDLTSDDVNAAEQMVPAKANAQELYQTAAQQKQATLQKPRAATAPAW
jgi:hypothetical protein